MNYLKQNKTFRSSKELNSLITKDCNIFLGRIYFTSNDGSQNTFFSQPTLDALELKRDKGTYYVICWKSKGVFNCNNILIIVIGITFDSAGSWSFDNDFA